MQIIPNPAVFSSLTNSVPLTGYFGGMIHPTAVIGRIWLMAISDAGLLWPLSPNPTGFLYNIMQQHYTNTLVLNSPSTVNKRICNSAYPV